jgi:hypothetical protein
MFVAVTKGFYIISLLAAHSLWVAAIFVGLSLAKTKKWWWSACFILVVLGTAISWHQDFAASGSKPMIISFSDWLTAFAVWPTIGLTGRFLKQIIPRKLAQVA